jgi:acetate kinase
MSHPTFVVTVNSGSTSVKLAAFASTSGEVACVRSEHHDGSPDPEQLLRKFSASLQAGSISAVAHRVVHGGTQFTEPVIVDEEVLAAISALEPLAPLHNPPALAWIHAAQKVFETEVPHVAMFDTAFFAPLPRVAAAYAIPDSLSADGSVRRYGFHGIAHQSMWQRWCELRPDLDRGGRLISLQLGGGCSVAAVAGGKPLDVSMGFSPLEGLVMATRSGDIDAAIIPYLGKKLALPGETIVSRLNRESGLLGMSGSTGEVTALLEESSPQARFAIELYCYRAKKYIGSFLTVLGGCDGIVFGGGVGEHVPQVRRRILEGMRWAGIDLDAEANEHAKRGDGCLSSRSSAVEIHALHVDEEISLARAAAQLLKRAHPG